MWFPRTLNEFSPYPWANKEIFNSFDYNVDLYAINPYQILSDMTDSSENTVYVFYDASTSKSYLIQERFHGSQYVIVSQIIRPSKPVHGKFRRGYLIYPIEAEGGIRMLQPVGESIKSGKPSGSPLEPSSKGRTPMYFDNYTHLKTDVQKWIDDTTQKPSESTNAHHGYKYIFTGNPPFIGVLNWNLFPNTILDRE